MLQQVCYPLRVLDIRLPPWYGLHVLRIDYDRLQAATLYDVVDRLPIGPCALHCDHFAAFTRQPVRHAQYFLR